MSISKQISINNFFLKDLSPSIMTTSTVSLPIKNKLKSIKINYNCKYCNTVFNKKTELIVHNEKSCELLHNIQDIDTTDDITDDNDIIPNNKELYQAIKNLTNKVFKLETEIAILKTRRSIGSRITKLDILEQLNNNLKPEKTYIEWLNNIIIKSHNLQKVFNSSLSEGIIEILTEYGENVPIRIFTNRKKIYIYSQNENQEFPRWNDNMTVEELYKFIDIICGRFLEKFLEWWDENKQLIDTNYIWDEKCIYYTSIISRTPAMTVRIYSTIIKFLTRKIEN